MYVNEHVCVRLNVGERERDTDNDDRVYVNESVGVREAVTESLRLTEIVWVQVRGLAVSVAMWDSVWVEVALRLSELHVDVGVRVLGDLVRDGELRQRECAMGARSGGCVSGRVRPIAGGRR